MKIQRQIASLRHQVQDVLREEIISGRLKPGERLVEQQLCKELDVSRTSLRESLRSLEAEGLVVLVRHRGAVVASVELSDARQIYQIRGVLEAQAVRNFVQHATEGEIKKLRLVLTELEARAEQEISGPELLSIKQRFYDVLFDIEESTVLQGVLEMLHNRVSLLRALSLGRVGRLENTITELRVMVEAIEERDVTRASNATLSHIESAAANVMNLLQQRAPKRSA